MYSVTTLMVAGVPAWETTFGAESRSVFCLLESMCSTTDSSGFVRIEVKVATLSRTGAPAMISLAELLFR